MFSHDNPDILWVSPSYNGPGKGTYEAPYAEVNDALKKVQPGNTIVLKAGEYSKSVNIQDSGTITEPIRIIADKDAQARVVCLATWFLYDVSDLILSGLSFKNIPQQAISVIGNCERNNFNGLRFINCGLDKKASCTFYFGGSGSKCNVIENCFFEIESKQKSDEKRAELPIALMISEGDIDDKTRLNTNHVFRGNIFTNYGCAVVIGTNDSSSLNYSHIFENNLVKNCFKDGIRVKCGDTVIRSNLFQRCRGKGISIDHGKTDLIHDNRIERCGTGIHIDGYDCTVKNNCIAKSSYQAIAITARSGKNKDLLGTTIVENNSCINSGTNSSSRVYEDILIDTNSDCIIQRNIFSSKGTPYIIKSDIGKLKQKNTVHIVNNITGSGSPSVKGCKKKQFSFKDQKSGNYSTTVPFGAKGWMASGINILPDKDTISQKPELKKYLASDKNTSQVDGLINEIDEKELYVRSLFLDAEADNIIENGDENTNEEIPNEDGMIDFSDWD